MGYYPNLHYNGNKIPIPCSGAIDIKEESACYSEVVNTEIQCTSTFNKPLFNDNQFTNVREKDRVICITNPIRKGSLDSVVSDSPQTDVDPNSGLESIYNIKHSPHTWKVQMKGAHENGEVVAEQLRVGDDGTNDNSLLDLSMRNLSLSSSLEVAPSVSSSSGLGGSLCGNPLPEHEVNSPSNQMDLRDKKLPSRSLPTEHFTDVGIHTSEALTNIAAQVSQRVGKGHANDNEKETILSSSNLQEKIHLKGSVRSSKVVGGTGSSLPVVYNHLATPELQCIKNSDLEEIRELGTGTYGTVFYGKWRGCDVAIKRIKPSCFTGGELGDKDRLVSDFWKEANLLGQLHHPNVLALYGVVSDGPVTQLATITEYMVNGSLKQVLKKNDRTIDRRKRIIIAMDAAFGMEYLHEKNIVHFDLKSHNFLVNMRDPLRPVCKIGDLGLSKVKQKTMVSGGVRGTIPWMAPELLTSKKCMVSEKVDVYSFGIVMWELLNGKEPYSDMRSEEIIAGVLKGDLRPEIPSWCEPQWRSLMERCWSTDPNSRPSFSKIAKELRVIAAGANIK